MSRKKSMTEIAQKEMFSFPIFEVLIEKWQYFRDALRDKKILSDIEAIANSIEKECTLPVLECRDKKNFYSTVELAATKFRCKGLDILEILLKNFSYEEIISISYKGIQATADTNILVLPEKTQERVQRCIPWLVMLKRISMKEAVITSKETPRNRFLISRISFSSSIADLLLICCTKIKDRGVPDDIADKMVEFMECAVKEFASAVSEVIEESNHPFDLKRIEDFVKEKKNLREGLKGIIVSEFEKFPQVHSIDIQERKDELHVFVYLTIDQYDYDLMDDLLDSEYEIREKLSETTFQFFYPSRGIVDYETPDSSYVRLYERGGHVQ